MIHKEIDPAPAGDKFERAGQDAERQMAFYLRRAFAEDQDIHVINDLRIARRREVAQIDHLIIHCFGMIIVESKSSHGIIRVNAQREFIRVYGSRATGMPSPIEQARRQGELLRGLLNDQKERLRSTRLGGLVQGGFVGCPIRLLAAVSDSGRIEGPRNAVPELCKADAIPGRIRGLFQQYHHPGTLIEVLKEAVRGRSPNRGRVEWSMPAADVHRTINFLLHIHQPRNRAAPPAAPPIIAPLAARPAQPPKPRQPVPGKAARAAAHPSASPPTSGTRRPVYLCSKCHSTSLTVRYALSYYFNCRDCGGNTPIRNICRGCNQMTRTSKSGNHYYSICDTCRTQALFFVAT